MTTALALSVATAATDIAGQEISRSLSGVAEVIADSANNVRVNKEAALALSTRISGLVNLLEEDAGESHVTGMPEFTRTIEEVASALDELGKQSYVAQMLHRARDAERLQALSQRVKSAFDVLMVGVHIDMHENAGIVTKTLADLKLLEDVDIPSARLPPCPQIFFGRATEHKDLVSSFDSTPAYACILGGPGMGKTSLAVAVSHDPTLEMRFRHRRYFVSFDPQPANVSCLARLCAALGVTSASSRTRTLKALQDALRAPPNCETLMVLDNFESVWDTDVRAEAEEVLDFLASLPRVSLIVTMRGAERPQGVAWSLPLLPPLARLDDSSALQLFLSISDMAENDGELTTLLAHLDNVPLALVLMASLAQYESLSELHTRWGTLKTAMLSRGHTFGGACGGEHSDRLSSLDASIMLSLSSPRMTRQPTATLLLSLLSLLPKGIHEAELHIWASASEACGTASVQALSTLLQTSLASRTQTGHLSVLAPIREYMLAYHTPSQSALSSLYKYHFEIAKMLRDARSTDPAIIMAVAPEIDNIYSCIYHALAHEEDPGPALDAAHAVLSLIPLLGVGSPALLPRALELATGVLRADLLLLWGIMASGSAMHGSPQVLWTQALELYKAENHAKGVVNATTRLADFLSPEDAVRSCMEMAKLAEQHGDMIGLAGCELVTAYSYRRQSRDELAYEWYMKAILTLEERLPVREVYLTNRIRLFVAQMEWDAGRVRPAVARLDASLEALREAGFKETLARAQMLRGEIYLSQGETRRAVELWRGCAASARAVRDEGLEIIAWSSLATAYLLLEDRTGVLDAIRRTKEIIAFTEAEGNNDPQQTAHDLIAKCELARLHGDLEGAGTALQVALNATRSQGLATHAEGMLFTRAEVLYLLGQVEQDSGHLDEARNCFMLVAIIQRRAVRSPQIVSALARLAHVAEDDELAERLLNAVTLPLVHYGFRPLLAAGHLCSGGIAMRRGQFDLARHRIQNAQSYVDEIENPRLALSVKTFLEMCM
ncbi:hypothetical protein EXIGLDRAFT_753568 [Exidia glandulosa HHB12029]|uniref:Uncharacterized protein n=1 Tax=Exidia glandulosa HHB12029 TaxID=1314781 RepID=A0A165DML8_EXIGL|nr:hypothetical protein EXIGLDRAFT_753568 [Exidia glandulosa HHB12029]